MAKSQCFQGIVDYFVHLAMLPSIERQIKNQWRVHGWILISSVYFELRLIDLRSDLHCLPDHNVWYGIKRVIWEGRVSRGCIENRGYFMNMDNYQNCAQSKACASDPAVNIWWSPWSYTRYLMKHNLHFIIGLVIPPSLGYFTDYIRFFTAGKHL